MAPNTLIDHLVGKSVMQDDVRQKWEAACKDFRNGRPQGLNGDVRQIRDPDKSLYCWRNKIYRWPDLPMTVAGQQANFSYPAFLAIAAVDAMYAYGDPCYCRVVVWVDNLCNYQRTGRPEFDQVVIGTTLLSGKPVVALDAFTRTYWQDDPEAFTALIAADPAAVVAAYLAAQLAGLYNDDSPPGFLRVPPGRAVPARPPEWALRL
jgi:hypothetical protein